MGHKLTDKLSVLIFSRNDAKYALSLIKDIYKVADEIVLVDSSNRKIHRGLLASKGRMGLAKLRIFYTIPIGYPDPLRMYALKKCRYRWVLLLDTDERLSQYGKDFIKEFISNTDASAFAIKRYEKFSGKAPGTFFTWQQRLFRKADVRFKGIVHEQPEVNGIVEKTPDNFYIGHLVSLRGRPSAEYNKMEIFDRMSYGIATDKLMDYFNKVVVPREGTVRDRWSGKALGTLLDAYRRLRLKRNEQELTDLDYFLFFALVDLGYRIKEGHLPSILSVYRGRKEYIKRLKGQQGKESDEILEISKIINDVGIIEYLGLDSERTIRKLNRRYADSKGGIDLLIWLLKERYEKGKRWLD